MRAADAAVSSSSSYSVPHSTGPWIADHPADGHGNVVDFVDRHVAVLTVVLVRLFRASAAPTLFTHRLGGAGSVWGGCSAGTGAGQFRGEPTGCCEPGEAVVAVTRAARRGRAASIDGGRARRRGVEMALGALLEACSGAGVRGFAVRRRLPAGSIGRRRRALGGLAGALPPRLAERAGVDSRMLALARPPAAERLCRCVREATESHAMPPRWDMGDASCSALPRR